MNPKPSIWCPGIRWSHPLAKGLVALWPFWEGAGGRVGNIVLPQYHMATFNTPTWVASRAGSAMLFDDGSNEYAERDAAPVTAAPFTVGGWIRPDAAILQCIFYLGDKDVDGTHQWAFYCTAAGTLRLYFNDAASDNVSTTTTYTINRWHHFCFVEAASNDHRVFLDGGGKGTKATDITPLNADRISIGRCGDSAPSLYFSGSIAEVAIWNVALTDAQVKELAADPWGLITPRRKTYFYVHAAGAPPAGGPPVGSLAMMGAGR